jgi:hypothetical protein
MLYLLNFKLVENTGDISQSELSYHSMCHHAYNPSIREAEAGGLRIQGPPGLHS